MADHQSTPVLPIFADFQLDKTSVRLWEIPPNGQGITALIALNILQHFANELQGMTHNSTEYLHLLIEAIRLAFADTLQHCADQESVKVGLSSLSCVWVAIKGSVSVVYRIPRIRRWGVFLSVGLLDYKCSYHSS